MLRVGFLNILTLIFVIAKLAGAIAWPWWAVFLPTIALACIWFALMGLVIVTAMIGAIGEAQKKK